MEAGTRSSILSALILALASLGDALLYPVLPLNAEHLGLPVLWVGFLLSVNRLIRLPTNQLFAWLFHRFGTKRITLVAAGAAVLSTFAYGVVTGLTGWIVARAMWGLAYASLRIACISYSLEGKNTGFLLGLNRGLQETGPILALILGPWLMNYLSLTLVFRIFAGISLGAVALAFFLPELRSQAQVYRFRFQALPNLFNTHVFLSALIVEGLLVVLIARLLDFDHFSLGELTAMTAFYLGYRRTCSIVVSPLAGSSADKLGLERVFLTALVLTVLAVFCIAFGAVQFGLVITFTAYSVSSALSPGGALTNSESRLQAIAANVTWRDLGSASGTLLGGYLLTVSEPQAFLVFCSGLLAVFLILHFIKSKHYQFFVPWK